MLIAELSNKQANVRDVHHTHNSTILYTIWLASREFIKSTNRVESIFNEDAMFDPKLQLHSPESHTLNLCTFFNFELNISDTSVFSFSHMHCQCVSCNFWVSAFLTRNVTATILVAVKLMQFATSDSCQCCGSSNPIPEMDKIHSSCLLRSATILAWQLILVCLTVRVIAVWLKLSSVLFLSNDKLY